MTYSMSKQILFFSEVNWDYLRQRHHFFSELYSNKNKVFYFGKIGLRYPKFSDFNSFKLSTKKEKVGLPENIIFPKIIFLPPLNLIFNLINRLFRIPKILSFLDKKSDVVLHFYQPTKLIIDLIDILKKNNFKVKIIYDCVQDYRYHPGTNDTIIKNEIDLVKKSDIVIADSVINLDRLKDYTDDILLIPPGVDLEHFKIPLKVNEIVKTSKIKLLYYGNIRKDLDIDLINKISEYKNIELTLVGLLNLNPSILSNNIKILPSIPYKDLPLLISNFDSLLLPYDINNIFTQAIIPAKFYECLATMLPIFSTKMKSTSDYHNSLNIINLNTDFKELKVSNLTINEINQRNNIINSCSWESRFNLFYNEI